MTKCTARFFSLVSISHVSRSINKTDTSTPSPKKCIKDERLSNQPVYLFTALLPSFPIGPTFSLLCASALFSHQFRRGCDDLEVVALFIALHMTGSRNWITSEHRRANESCTRVTPFPRNDTGLQQHR